MTALAHRWPQHHPVAGRRTDRDVPLTELALILAGETLDPAGHCNAFHLHHDGTATLIDHTGRTHQLTPSADGLYDLTQLGLPGPNQDC